MRVLIILVFGLFFMSCKKDKLEDGKEVFIGKWNWEYSRHIHQICSGDPPITDVITPETEGVNYSLTFLKKGIVEFYKNDTLLSKHPLIFNSFGQFVCSYDSEFIDINFFISRKASKANDRDYLMDGCVGLNELIFRQGFPYPAHEYQEIVDGCDYYTSYFVKE